MLAPNLFRAASGHLGVKILAAFSVSVFLIYVFIQTQPLEHHFSHFVSQTNSPAEPAEPVEPVTAVEPVVTLLPVVPQFYPYGISHCLPSPSPQLIEQAVKRNATCAAYAPPYGKAPPKHRVATITAQFGPLKQHYQRALDTHLLYSLIHNTQVHVLCDSLVDDLWNKHAFILDVLMREMLKPKEERLEWLMWVDRDTLILDQCRPAWSFLPPVETNKNLIVTNDWNGLNNGVFFLRVNKWAIDLFTTTLAFRYYRPDEVLTFTEQSAMEIVIKEQKFGGETQWVPQQWFNAYDRGSGSEGYANTSSVEDENLTNARRGDFLVHFAGIGNKSEAINKWMDTMAVMEDVWEAGTSQRDLTKDIAAFWQSLGVRG